MLISKFFFFPQLVQQVKFHVFSKNNQLINLFSYRRSAMFLHYLRHGSECPVYLLGERPADAVKRRRSEQLIHHSC